jgi:hypothetical protein
VEANMFVMVDEVQSYERALTRNIQGLSDKRTWLQEFTPVLIALNLARS